MTVNKFQLLDPQQKYDYIIKKRKEWSMHSDFFIDNILLLKHILKDMDKLSRTDLQVLSSLAIYSRNELIQCFRQYQIMPTKDKLSKSLAYFHAAYGKEEGTKRHIIYRQTNSDAVRLSASKRTDFRENSTFCVEHWIKQGYTLIESKKIISDIQTLNSRKYHDKMKANDTPYCNGKQLQYYLNKGHSLEVSKRLLSESQSTFSLQKCLIKYGDDLGLKIHKDRQLKWQNTLNSLPDDIKDKINDAKAVGWGRASKQSLKFFLPLYKKLRKLGIPREQIYFGVTGSNEYRLKGELGTRIYDFCILSYKIIIEFHGRAWHAKSEEESFIKTNPFGNLLSLSWKNDCYKKTLALANGFSIIELWSDEHEANYEKLENLITNIKG